jgi:hypothetical protein
MHALAKVLLTLLSIYWLVRAFGWLLRSFSYVFAYSPHDRDTVSISLMLVSIIVQGGIIAFLVMVLFKRDKITQRIAGDVEPSSVPLSQASWIAFAYRLVSVIAGLYCLSSAVFYLNSLINCLMFRMYRGYASSMLEYGISLFIMLVAGIYLFRGAPSFVKWQTKKTIELCNSNSKNQSD